MVKQMERVNSLVQGNITRRKELNYGLSMWECLKFYMPWVKSHRIMIFREVCCSSYSRPNHLWGKS